MSLQEDKRIGVSNVVGNLWRPNRRIEALYTAANVEIALPNLWMDLYIISNER